MYSIYVDSELFCSSNDDSTAIINPIITLKANNAGDMSFTIPPNHPGYDTIQRRASYVQVFRDNDTEPIFSGVCTSESVDFYKQKKLTFEGELTFLNDSVLRPHHYENQTVQQLLSAYLTSHNSQVDDFKKFTIGTVTVTDPNNSISCYTNMNSTMQEIKEDLLDDLGGYIRIRHENNVKYFDYLNTSPREASQTIELGKNLIDYTSNIDNTQIATRIIPLGAKLSESSVEGIDTRLTIESVNDGLDYIQSGMTDTYGVISTVVIWDNVTTASVLKAKAQQYLSDIQFENVTVSASAIDLGYVSSESKFRLLDKVRVISQPHGMDRYFVLTEMTLNLNEPDKDTFKFGSDDKLSLTARTISENTELIKKIEANDDKSGIIAAAVEQATNMITGEDGGSVVIRMDDENRPFELLICDTSDYTQAEKVWRWNVNGLGFSSSGYNGSYSTAITQNGAIVADFITAGTLTGIKINNGNGSFSVDENGNVLSEEFVSHYVGTVRDPNEVAETKISKGLVSCSYDRHIDNYGDVSSLIKIGPAAEVVVSTESKLDSGITTGSSCVFNSGGVSSQNGISIIGNKGVSINSSNGNISLQSNTSITKDLSVSGTTTSSGYTYGHQFIAEKSVASSGSGNYGFFQKTPYDENIRTLAQIASDGTWYLASGSKSSGETAHNILIGNSNGANNVNVRCGGEFQYNGNEIATEDYVDGFTNGFKIYTDCSQFGLSGTSNSLIDVFNKMPMKSMFFCCRNGGGIASSAADSKIPINGVCRLVKYSGGRNYCEVTYSTDTGSTQSSFITYTGHIYTDTSTSTQKIEWHRASAYTYVTY